jgi:hypothetical protein
MERKVVESNESDGSAAGSRPISQCRKEDDVGPENQPRASWSPTANTEREADDAHQLHTAALDQLELQICTHLSKQQQQQQQQQQPQTGELHEDSQPHHVNDSWGSSVMPHPYRRGGDWDGAGAGNDSVQEGAAPSADMRGEATTPPSNPRFHHLPASAMPPMAKSYLFPSSMIAQQDPNSTDPPNLAGLSQRMEPGPASNFYQGAGGGDSRGDGPTYFRGAGQRSSSDVMPQPLPPYMNVSRSSISSFSDGAGSPFAYPGRNFGSNAASLPFPIITIPFRSTTSRPSPAASAAAKQGVSAATAGVGAASGLREHVASSGNVLQSLAAGLAWDGPFPTSGKEPTFPMKLYVLKYENHCE